MQRADARALVVVEHRQAHRRRAGGPRRIRPGCARRCGPDSAASASTPTLRVGARRGLAGSGAFIACPAAARAPARRCRAASAAPPPSDGCGRAGSSALSLAEALEEERHERRVLRAFATLGEQRVELARVGRAVVRRQLHADDQHPGARPPAPRRPSRRDCRASTRGCRRAAPSLPPSSMIDDRRLVLREQRRQARASAGGRVAADARVDDAVRIALGRRAAPPAGRPSPVPGGEAVGGRDRVADDEDHRRAVGRGARAARRSPARAASSERERSGAASSERSAGGQTDCTGAHCSGLPRPRRIDCESGRRLAVESPSARQRDGRASEPCCRRVPACRARLPRPPCRRGTARRRRRHLIRHSMSDPILRAADADQDRDQRRVAADDPRRRELRRSRPARRSRSSARRARARRRCWACWRGSTGRLAATSGSTARRCPASTRMRAPRCGSACSASCSSRSSCCRR